MSSSSFENNTDVNGCKKPQQQQHAEITIKVVSATYRPYEGLRLSTRALTNDETASIPISRDVAPFLRALLLAAQLRETKHRATDDVDAAAAMNNMCDDDPGEEGDDLLPHIVRVQPTVGGLTKSFIYLLGGGSKSMNAIFGDPCPGTSKRLHVHYVVTEAMVDDDIESRVAKTEVHHVNFAEHERVVLRRRLTFFQDDSQLTEAVKHTTSEREQTSRRLLQDSTASATIFQPTEMDSPEPLSSTRDIYEEMLRNARKMGRSQSIVELQQLTPESLSSFSSSLQPAHSTGCQEQLHRWRLRSAVSEIVLPIALPFLELRERVQCRRVCRSWKHVIRDWGVATTIDSNDQNITNFSRPFLRGVLSHSYSSLHSLFLSGFEILAKEDLHPAIPHLRKLRYLDVARCHTLDDSTMELLSQEVSQTLEVLYIKGLRNVTDVGLRAICQSCKLMEVLDISCVPITDEGGTAIAQLKRLRALFTRDNYHLTNRSIDVITESCTRLEQLTLWGCTRMQHLGFDNDAVNIKQKSAFNSGKLVVLNLWGCHSLKDEAAESLGCMKNLVSLIVSECHRLTDQFLIKLVSRVPQLNHMHLRYCKRITDTGVNVIANNMLHLYSLDLSFCTRVTAASISKLLETRHDSLSELRLKSCNKLEIARDPEPWPPPEQRGRRGGDAAGGSAGRLILNAIRSHLHQHCLCVLDVRECGGQPNATSPYPESDPFVPGMKKLQFEQQVPGFFSRPARWSTVQQNLLEQMNLQETEKLNLTCC